MKQHSLFSVTCHHDTLFSVMHPDDPYQMNWIEGKTAWGTIKAPNGLTCTVSRRFTERGTLLEEYCFTNTIGYELFINTGDLGIYTPFNDSYEEDLISLTQRCHTHIHCGKESSYIMGLRMGNIAPHLGLILTQGSLGGYSIERDESHGSNDRGDIILHPDAFSLIPGESYILSWELFWHNGKKDFFKKASTYPHYLHVEADNFTIFHGEQVKLSISATQPILSASVTCNGLSVESFDIQGKNLILTQCPNCLGELHYDITVNGIHTKAELLALPSFEELLTARCRFIVEKQQFCKPNSRLDGAYLTYDNETDALVYRHWWADQNGGRERVGMGVLLAFYLQSHSNASIRASLDKYITYIKREMLIPETGLVLNEMTVGEIDDNRHYNAPWMAVLFLEYYKVTGNPEDLLQMYRILKCYYDRGGEHFYGIGIPCVDAITALRQEGLDAEAETLLQHFKAQADFFIEQSLNYPAHEVKYEQSIVAPAVVVLAEVYQLTREPKYLAEAEKQLAVLSLFNGEQPDYHLYETAIRHWDNFWFGKAHLYGDTLPHYWSSLTGNAYIRHAESTNSQESRNKAEQSYRGVLSLFRPDGSASCTMLYPLTVNGQKGHFYDAWANDQDWGLYYAAKHGSF